MVKLQYLILAISFTLLVSCNPKVSTSITKSYPVLDYRQEVVVLGLNDEEPDSVEVLGQVQIGDTGFSTNCDYEVVINEAKYAARKIGGNAIKIIDHRPPSMASSCHRIVAKILKVDETKLQSFNAEEEIIPNIDYAILKIYRFGGMGALVSYNLYLDDEIIGRVRSNYKTTIHINEEGKHIIWAKTEAKEEIPIEIKHGKTYYLRCSLGMGVLVGQPKIELVDGNTGKSEFDSFNAKHQ